jgi:hypothetical protein
MNTQALERAITKTATVTVQYVNLPKQGRKSGSIKDVDGQFFGVWPTMLAQFQEGETYEIEYTEKTVNGVVYRDVKAVHPAVDAEQFRAPAPQPSRPQPQPKRSAPMQQPAPQNGNGNGNGNGWYRPTHPRDAERMFVCSTLNAYIQTGRINDDVDALLRAVNTLRQVWQETFGADDLAAG